MARMRRERRVVHRRTMSRLGFATAGLLLLASGAAGGDAPETPDVLALVDTFVGTGAHGHTYPGATVPFGMVQVSPDTHTNGWDWCSGYHYSDSSIMGFSLTHLSGTGIGDMLDVLLMPTTGPVRLEPGSREDPDSGYRSRFSHPKEEASPGYYSVVLADTDIRVELTATERVGFQRYTFPQAGPAHVVLDLDHRSETGTPGSTILDSEIEIRGDDTLVGWRRVTRWARDRHLYFAARFSMPFASATLAEGTTPRPGLRRVRGTGLKARVDYRTTAGEAVLVRVAISPTSVDSALRNLEAEASGVGFDAARAAAAEAWRRELSKIAIEGGTRKQRRTFYSALYHAFLAPTLFADVDGSYRGLDGRVRKAEGFRYHSTFSLWDTYRAAHPLYCLVQRERTRDFARTLVRMAVESPTGQMPVWPLANDETNCMIGYHSASVLAEAWAKGIRDFDVETALDRLKAMAAKAEYRGLGAYGRLGWVPSDEEGESVSKTLEYSYDDWCVSRLAKALGREEDERAFRRRAGQWRDVFDPATGFARPRLADGTFASPFDPARYGVSARWHDYTEGNAWQYTFAAQHDPEGYARALGGRAALETKLDALFSTPLDAGAAGLPVDVTGLIGQYAHGNEPSHHLAYLYTYAGAPWKTEERVRQILDTLYGDTPDGLSGNEDCGQMSAWYVLSAVGLYPVDPAGATYVLASPLFDRATVDLGGGRRFTVVVERSSPSDLYVQSATLGGEPLARAWIRHDELMTAGELRVVLGPKPNPGWGSAPSERPPSMSDAAVP
jgi:predicted alpha-1,2-mannosidase